MKDLKALQEQEKRVREELNTLKQQIQEAQKPKKWKPDNGFWAITGDGKVIKTSIELPNYDAFGMTRSTEKAATEARDRMLTRKLLEAYVDEHKGDWVADWDDHNQKKYYVYFDHNCGKYAKSFNAYSETIGQTYGPMHVADTLLEGFNNKSIIFTDEDKL